jgi:D-alanyl-D-alanine carboxypeptidase (penicillin-binding protein 5/6)
MPLRRSLAAILCCGLLLGAAAAPALAAPAAGANPLGIQAQSAVLLDARADQVLYSYNPDERMQPASLAKMMTFLLALEALQAGRVQPDTQVLIQQDAWQLAAQLGPLSDMALAWHSLVPFKDLLYGLVVSSGNDAAVAIADQLAGSQQAFVAEMNARAAQLGLTNTHFATVHGLPAPDQYTTAMDMARLAQYIVLHHPEAEQYTSQPSFTWNGITQNNWNLPLMKMDPRVFGLKTGHVDEAGYHLAAAARQGNQLLIAVVMGTASDQARAAQADALLKYGFDTYDTVQLPWQRYAPASVPVWEGSAERVALAPAGPLWVAVRRDEEASLAAHASLRQPVVAPLDQGAVLGQLEITVAGQGVRTVPLVAATAVRRGGLIHVLWDDLRLLVGRLWHHVHR